MAKLLQMVRCKECSCCGDYSQLGALVSQYLVIFSIFMSWFACRPSSTLASELREFFLVAELHSRFRILYIIHPAAFVPIQVLEIFCRNRDMVHSILESGDYNFGPFSDIFNRLVSKLTEGKELIFQEVSWKNLKNNSSVSVIARRLGKFQLYLRRDCMYRLWIRLFQNMQPC